MSVAYLRAMLASSRARPWTAASAANHDDHWAIFDENGIIITNWLTEDEARFIVAAVNALPALLDELEQGRRE